VFSPRDGSMNNDLLPAKARQTTSPHLEAAHFIPVNIIPPGTNPQMEGRFTLAI
jgi:hypothetical protein